MDEVMANSEEIRKAGKYGEYAHRARKMREGIKRPNLSESGERIGESTHIMVSANIDDRNVAFPTLFPHKNRPNRWIDYDKGGDISGAYLEAKGRGEVFEFGQDKKESEKFAKGSWKPK